MTITFNEAEIKDIIDILQQYKELSAELKTPSRVIQTPTMSKSSSLLKLAEELEQPREIQIVPSPNFAAIASAPKPARRAPAKKRMLTQEEKAYFRIIANQKCKSTTTIEKLVETFGMTPSAIRSHITRSPDLDLIKGRDLIATDIWPNAVINPKTLYIRSKH